MLPVAIFPSHPLFDAPNAATRASLSVQSLSAAWRAYRARYEMLSKLGAARRALMASIGSLSPFLPRPGLPFASPANPNPSLRLPPPGARTLRYLTRAERKGADDAPPSPAATEKKSLAVATGELFLGLASMVMRIRTKDEVVLMEREREYYSQKIKQAAPVVDDDGRIAGGDVIWEQKPEDVEAERERPVVSSPGFSFSAAGLLFPYHLGVAQFLLEKGYIKETTPLAGSSAGAIVCAVVASGNTMQEAMQVTKVLAEDCRLNGTAFRLGAVLRDILDKFLPDDIHIRSNGRIRIAITQLLWRPKGLLVDHFNSKEDLINALITSSFIPGYLAPRPATLFRNRLCIDGGLTLFMPPTSASNTVSICAFPTQRLRINGIGISPDCNPENRATPRQLFNWALEPAGDEILDRLFELGYLDASVWASQNPVESIVKDESRTESL